MTRSDFSMVACLLWADVAEEMRITAHYERKLI
jgi:hypothetical protein